MAVTISAALSVLSVSLPQTISIAKTMTPVPVLVTEPRAWESMRVHAPRVSRRAP
jgi:hypothetical protein